MSWTGRPEGQACCPGANGAVRSEERIARLLHTRLLTPPETDPFKRDELFPPRKGGFDNTCGNADGMSVVRSTSLSDADIRQRAQRQAERQPGRNQEGAIVAEVSAVRGAKAISFNGQQIGFVYDDPLPDEPLHAVVRGREVSRPEQDEIREEIRKAFAGRVSKL